LEKLWIHGGAQVDFAENVTRGHDHWRESYVAQTEQKQRQLDQMLRFAETHGCRMAALVRHFGDLTDSQKRCGICDFCAPADCIGQKFRPLLEAEQEAVENALGTLRINGSYTTGKLHGELFPKQEMTRSDFEELLGSMGRAGLVRFTEETFEKDGKVIPYRKVHLTPAGHEAGVGKIPMLMKDEAAATAKRRKRKKGKKKVARAQKREAPARTPPPPPPPAPPAEKKDSPVEESLRQWRMAEAKRRGVPPFKIISDQALKAIAARKPGTTAELLAIPGIGIQTVEKYGAAIYRILHERR
jgi:superfamily II DNA helicase RecQ